VEYFNNYPYDLYLHQLWVTKIGYIHIPFMHKYTMQFVLASLLDHNQLHFSIIVKSIHNFNFDNYNEVESFLYYWNSIPVSSLTFISGLKSLEEISNSFSTSFMLFDFTKFNKHWLFSFFYYHQPYQADLCLFLSFCI